MPELPEVETVRRTLEHQINNETITEVEVYYSPILENIDVDTFKNKLKNQTFRQFKRYGKYLIFIFDTVSLITHLRMEGKFFIKPVDEIRSIHEHIVFTFSSSITLRYHDTRKFGKMVLLETTNFDEIMKYPSLRKLGPEANTINVTLDYLYNKLTKRHDSIKVALLDQEVMAGLGNIYVDEVCFLSKLHPTMSCDLITKEDVENIIKYSKIVLDKAILAGGTTIRSYTSSLGVTGRFQLSLLCHSREGEKCNVCNDTIIKTFVGGRGTYYCPTCQKLRRPLVIGITGGIASGKSTVVDEVRKHGYQVIDADQVVHELQAKGGKLYQALLDWLGDGILKLDGELDRQKLGQMIFASKEMLAKSSQIQNGIIRQELARRRDELAKSQEVFFMDIPLLIERDYVDWFDDIWLVFIDEKTQLERLVLRNHLTREEAQKRIASQMSTEAKKSFADKLLDNSGDIATLKKKVAELLAEL